MIRMLDVARVRTKRFSTAPQDESLLAPDEAFVDSANDTSEEESLLGSENDELYDGSGSIDRHDRSETDATSVLFMSTFDGTGMVKNESPDESHGRASSRGARASEPLGALPVRGGIAFPAGIEHGSRRCGDRRRTNRHARDTKLREGSRPRGVRRSARAAKTKTRGGEPSIDALDRARLAFDTERRARRRYVASCRYVARERRDEGTTKTNETITACTRPERRRGESANSRRSEALESCVPTAVPRRSAFFRDGFRKKRRRARVRRAALSRHRSSASGAVPPSARRALPARGTSSASSASPCHETRAAASKASKSRSGRRDAPPSGGGDGDARARRARGGEKAPPRTPRARLRRTGKRSAPLRTARAGWVTCSRSTARSEVRARSRPHA